MPRISELPLQLLESSPDAEKVWQDVNQDEVREMLEREFNADEDYMSLSVEVASPAEDLTNKITIHVAYSDRYLFESLELILDKFGTLKKLTE